MNVADFCISPCSQYVYVGVENTILVFDILNNQEIDQFQYGDEEIRSIVSSSDGTFLYSGTNGGNLIIQNLIDRSIETIPLSEKALTSMVLNNYNSRIACGTSDGEIILTDIQGSSIERWKAHKDLVTDIEFSKDGTLLMSSGMDGKIIVTNLSKDQSAYSLQERRQPCRDIAMNSDMSTLLASYDNGKVYKWFITSDKEFIDDKTYRIRGWVTGVSFHRDNKSWASCTSSGNVKIMPGFGSIYSYKVEGVPTRIKFCYCRDPVLVVLVSVYNRGLILLSAVKMKNSNQ